MLPPSLSTDVGTVINQSADAASINLLPRKGIVKG
jgi:hypothetical protein